MATGINDEKVEVEEKGLSPEWEQALFITSWG